MRAKTALGDGAAGGEIDGELFADAIGRASDEDDLIFKIHKATAKNYRAKPVLSEVEGTQVNP